MRLNAYLPPLLALLLAGPASAGVVYDVPSSAILYGHNVQDANYRAAGSFQSDTAGSNLTSVTWYVRVDSVWAAANGGSNNPLPGGTSLSLYLYSNVNVAGQDKPGVQVASLGQLSIAGLTENQGMQAFSLGGFSTPLSPSTYYWIVGSSNGPFADSNTPSNGAIEIGIYANTGGPFPSGPAYTAYPTYGALLSIDGGSTWSGGLQAPGYGFFLAGQVTVPETASSLPLVGLSSALLGFLALRRRR